MRYANSLKYVDGFDRAGEKIDFSPSRLSYLCSELGKISLGTKFIHFGGNRAGHGLALTTEAIIKSAGYRVGRISTAYRYDPRRSIYINGKIPSIDDFNKAVAAMRKAAGKCDAGKFSREEVVISLALLICKFEGCEFILLECSREDPVPDPFSSLAPYDIAVIPQICEGESSLSRAEEFCRVMKLGVREVISATQRPDVYSYIENSCFRAGLRLTIPVRAQLECKNSTFRSVEFVYKGKEYTLKSASPILRDCAATAVEISQAIRRDGVKIAGTAIAEGIASLKGIGFFDVISSCPLIVADICESVEDAEAFFCALSPIMEKTASENLLLCIESAYAESCFAAIRSTRPRLDRIYLLGDGDIDSETEIFDGITIKCFATAEDMIDTVMSEREESRAIAIIGSPVFSEDVKNIAVNKMHGV